MSSILAVIAELLDAPTAPSGFDSGAVGLGSPANWDHVREAYAGYQQRMLQVYERTRLKPRAVTPRFWGR